MDLNERKLRILQAIISDFIYSAEPVGSRTLSKKYDMGISPATIRNEMSDLEEMGFLTHPHTSAGRVPSDKAYRLYVDNLMRKYEIPEDEKKLIADKLTSNVIEMEKTIQHAASLLSELTNLTAFAMTPKPETDRIRYIKLMPVDDATVILMIAAESGKVSNTALKIAVPYNEEGLEIIAKAMTYSYKGKSITEALKLDIIKTFESDLEAMSRLAQNIMPNFLRTLERMLDVNLYMDGLTNIFSFPEYNDIDKAKVFLQMLDKKDYFRDILINRDNGVIITIGGENSDEVIKDCSLITATYHVDGKMVGKIGVIGPKRMKYDEVTSIIEYITENLSNTFKLPGGNEQ
ncbi:MAG: heat-inducible transcriptional repressor HrcA [Clostridiales bacterium]|nr:heat-inducible transcriptional repressor HrcA [Clostridiales bacterium]